MLTPYTVDPFIPVVDFSFPCFNINIEVRQVIVEVQGPSTQIPEISSE